MARARRAFAGASVAALLLLIVPLPWVESTSGDIRLSVAAVTTTSTSATPPAPTTTPVAAPTTTRSLPRPAAKPRTAVAEAAANLSPRAPAPASGTGGIAKAVWDVPGSGYQRGEQVVALTFDDGPDARWTPQIIDVLDRYDTQATFFPIGRMAAAHPELVRRASGRGDGIGNHTWDHVDLRRTSDYTHQVDDATRVLSDLTAGAVGCLRPPFGSIDGSVTARLRSRGLTAVLWDVDTRDFSRPGTDAIVQRALSGARPGSIILLHDGGGDRSQTVAALPRIIEGLQRLGLRSVALCRSAPPPPAASTTTSTTPPDTTSTTTAPFVEDTTTTTEPVF